MEASITWGWNRRAQEDALGGSSAQQRRHRGVHDRQRGALDMEAIFLKRGGSIAQQRRGTRLSIACGEK
jgi:hypothetical protein